MKIKIIPVWDFIYDQVAAEGKWRKVDFHKDDGDFDDDNDMLVVFMCFGFAPRKEGEHPKFEYKDKYVVRKVVDIFRGFAGLKPLYIAFTMVEFDQHTMTDEQLDGMKKGIKTMIEYYEANNKILPMP